MKTRYTIDVDNYTNEGVLKVERMPTSDWGTSKTEVRLLRGVKVTFDCGVNEVLSPPDNMGIRYPQKKANGDIYLSFGGWLSDVAPDKAAA